MKIAILAPIKTSLFSMITTHLLAAEPGIEVTAIVVRTPWSLQRLRHEIRRDGVHLLKKIYNKMIVGESVSAGTGEDDVASMAHRLGLTRTSLVDISKACNIPLVVVKEHNSVTSADALKRAGADLIVFTGGGLIRKNILQIPRLGVLNCHPGMLPEYRGMDVIEWTAAEDATSGPGFGLTLHFMNEGVDTGPILLQRPIPVKQGDTFESIRTRLLPMTIELILEGVRRLRDDKVELKYQDVKAGRQYYVMHPRMYEYALLKLQALNHDRRSREENCGE